MGSQLSQEKYVVRRGQAKDFMPYLEVCQLAAATAYSDYPADSEQNLFGPKHYFHQTIMPYWQDMAQNTPTSMWWVAEVLKPRPKIVGGIAVKIHPAHYEGLGFYVTPEWQNQGIGQTLWKVRQKHAGGPLFFEVYAHASRTISMHERHGAKPTGKKRTIHWDSWPKDVHLTALEYKQA
ncbi:MAG TPA: GNAT family N-acetyltransferase [Candidatus Binatia bacterium]|nr:GNAT family N-acetyltransferase [Candidatus Binatia bacterium]